MMLSIETKANELMPAGGTNPDYFDCKEAWYPVHYLEDLDKSKPTPFTLLGENIVIWWDKQSNSWKAFEDKCPHRLVPLSEGRISDDGLLECPYHGWAFAGNGQCERIPQQEEGGKGEISKRACVSSFATSERQGMLFIYGGNLENAEKTKIPIVEPIEESPDDWVVIGTFRDLPYDAFTLLENVLDASHVPFTHHNTVGNRANASPVNLEVLESGKHGFRGTWKEGPRRGKLGQQDTTFIAPNLMWHDLTSKQYGRTLTVVYATPTRKGECRLFARFPFKFSSKLPGFFIKLTPRWYSHIGQNSILEDDQIFLHHQERYLQQQGGSENFTKAFYLPTTADKYIFELRQWINQYHVEPFPGETLPPLLPKYKLLDRYHSHTVNCASCRNALEKIKKISQLSGMIAVILLATIPMTTFFFGKTSVLPAIIQTALPLVFAGVWLYLGKLSRKFYEGINIPPRNI